LAADREREFRRRAKCGSIDPVKTTFSSSDSCAGKEWPLLAGIASLYCGEGVCGSPVSAEDELDSGAPLSPPVYGMVLRFLSSRALGFLAEINAFKAPINGEIR
jgi:hypothetical protein